MYIDWNIALLFIYFNMLPFISHQPSYLFAYLLGVHAGFVSQLIIPINFWNHNSFRPLIELPY